MRQNDIVSRPANDNPHDDHQLELFPGPVFTGIDWGRAPSIGVVADIRDGEFRGFRVVEGMAR